MKKKFSKIWGIGLTVVLLASLMVFAVPVSAGELYWESETLPTAAGKILGAAGFDVLDLAIASDGVTIYAACKTDASDKILYKSVNGGYSWTDLSSATGLTILKTQLVAVAPDDPDTVAVVDSDNATVYVSTNGGAYFSSLGTVQETGGGTASKLYSVDIAPERLTVSYIAVGGETGSAAGLWLFNLHGSVTAWVDATTAAGGWTAPSGTGLINAAGDQVRAVKFSPNFDIDDTMVAITYNASTTEACFQIACFADKTWNVSANFGDSYPVAMEATTTTLAIGTSVDKASISLASTYDGTEADTRIAFVGLRADSSNTEGGIYRLVNTTIKELKPAIGIRSIAYNTDADKLVAGSYGDNQVYRADEPTATSITVKA